MKKLIFLTVLTAFLLSPLAAWALYKPTRVLMPHWAGVTCVSETLCIDDVSKSKEMQRMYDDALAAVQGNIGAIREKPRGIFCTTHACAKRFGNAVPGAFNVGTSGFVINPRGMRPHFVEHEMIHHLQNERLGIIAAWMKPVWWREGMAYSLSRDPRRPIPGDGTLEGYRAKFEVWYAGVDKGHLWEVAENL